MVIQSWRVSAKVALAIAACNPSLIMADPTLPAQPPASAVPRALDPLPAVDLPGNISQPTMNQEGKRTIPRATPSASRVLPRTLPTDHQRPSRSPIFDAAVRKVSAEVPSTAAGTAPDQTVAPSVQFRQIAPPQIMAGVPTPIEFIVTNSGDTAVDKVIVTDSIDSAVEVVSANPRSEQSGNTLVWSLGRLEPRETKRITVTVLASRGASADLAASRATVSFSTGVNASIRLLTPDVVAKVDGPTVTLVGQPIELVLHLHNQGNSQASGVSLRCVLPPAIAHVEGPELEYEVGILAAGETRSIPLTLSAAAEGDALIKIQVQADGLAATEAEHVVAVEDYHLTVECDGPPARYLNQTCAYTVLVTNHSSDAIAQAVTRMQLPVGMTFAHAGENGQWDADSRSVVWTIDSLPAGQSREFTIAAVGTQIGEQTWPVQVLVGPRTITSANTTTTIKGIAALSVEVVDLHDPIEVNGETIYEIHVINQGTMAATNVQVICEIPHEIEAIAADGPTSQKISGQTLQFDSMAELAPHAEAIFRVKCRGTAEAQARFKTTVKTDQLNAPISEEESTTIFGGP